MFGSFGKNNRIRAEQAPGQENLPGGENQPLQEGPYQQNPGQQNPGQPGPGQQQPGAGPAGYNPATGIPYGPGQALDSSRRKSGVLATLLSLFPGLGQVYVGYYQVGFSFALTVITIIAMLNSDFGRGKEPFLGTFMAFFWIFNMLDANRRAAHYNRFMAGVQGDDVPGDFKTAGGIGSVPVGVILILAGFLFILDLNFGVSLEWIENWWPLALVGFGGWLIFKGRQNG